MQSNLRLYPWFKFAQSLIFWQAVWFLFFQDRLSAAEAILIYALYDIFTTVLEVPSGYLSDRVGRRITLVCASVAVLIACVMQGVGGGFWVYALAQVALGAGMAFASGTDSSLLYESLAREGREAEVEQFELRAWRAQFVALALSALGGGALATWEPVAPFWMTAIAALWATLICWRFQEPPHGASAPEGAIVPAFRALFANPVLLWCFVLSLSMYAFSHVPFVFGQPFILEALAARGWAAEAPLVSGAVSAAMMVVSVGTSWLAPALRATVGLGGILLLAFSLQIGLIAALAASNEAIVIVLLLIRMVPDSLSRAFLLARIQPLLPDARRATWLSLQSFAGRLLFAGSLIVFSGEASDEGTMPYDEIRSVLSWYVGAGLLILACLVLSVRRARMNEAP